MLNSYRLFLSTVIAYCNLRLPISKCIYPVNPLMWRGCHYSSLIEKNPKWGDLIQLRTSVGGPIYQFLSPITFKTFNCAPDWTRTSKAVRPKDFLTTTVFTAIPKGMFVVWTLPQPYPFQDLGNLRQVSTPSLFLRLGSVLPFYRFHRI